MAISPDMIRGHTDTIVLSNLEKSDNYGYEINKSIKEATDGIFELKEATLYTAFRRMEEAGFISSYWGDEETGARRRYYTITDLGVIALAQNRREWAKTKELIDKLIIPIKVPG